MLNDTIALWAMNEGTGQTVHDSGTKGLDGVLGTSTSLEGIDPAWTTPGRFSASGLSFDWTQNTYVSVNQGYPVTPTGITVEAWVKPTNSLYHQLFTQLSVFEASAPLTTPTMYVALSTGAAGIRWGLYDEYGSEGLQDTNSPISLDTWHYVAVTFNGVNMNAYLDGVSVGSLLSNTVTMSSATKITWEASLAVARAAAETSARFASRRRSTPPLTLQPCGRPRRPARHNEFDVIGSSRAKHLPNSRVRRVFHALLGGLLAAGFQQLRRLPPRKRIRFLLRALS